MTRPLTPLTVLVLSVMAAGCSPAPPQREIALRFIDEPAQELWQPDYVLRRRQVRVWRPGEADEFGHWTIRNADLQAEPLATGLALRGSKRQLRLVRSVHLPADTIDAFEIELEATRRLEVTLDWARRGERFGAQRRIRLSSQEVAPGVIVSARLEVAGHPEWQGTIRRLRIALAGPRDHQVTVRRLTALRELASPEALADAMGRGWLLDLGGDVRSVLLAPPGLPIARSLEIPRQARLSLGYSVPAGLPAPVRFRATFAADGTGDGDEPERELFVTEIGGEQADAWHQAEIDLAPLAGRSGRLRLDTELLLPTGPAAPDPATHGPAARPYDPFRDGSPAWTNPEVIAPAGRRSRRRPHVVLISIDTLRADRLSLYGNPRQTSPYLDAWAGERATVFETAVAAAPWTLPTHTTLLTGIEAYRHGVNFGFPAPPELETLAERLRGAGYRTLAVTGGSFLDPRYGLAQGFDRYEYFSRRSGDGAEELESGLADAVALLAEAPDRPFFLFFHTYEVHAPYRLRQPFFERLAGYRPGFEVEPSRDAVPLQPGGAPGKPLRAVPIAGLQDAAALPPDGAPELTVLARDLYDASVAFTDDRLRRLFDALAEHGLSDETLIVLTSDHGEMLGEHGVAGHSYLYDQNLLVPLVIAPPGKPARRRGAGRRVARQVRQADVLPTVLELAGLEVPEGLDGRSLVALMRGRRDAGTELPDVAVSYMPQPLRGASIRLGDRVKHVLRTSAWAANSADGVSFDLRDDPAEAWPLPGDRRLDRRLRRLLSSAYQGLLLQIDAGPRGLVAELEGASISRRGVHSLDADCRCVRWRSEGLARIEAPAGSRITLRLEEPAGHELAIRAEIPGAGESGNVETTFRLFKPRPQRLVWIGDGWKTGRAAAAGGATTGPALVLRWRGGPPERPLRHAAEEGSELKRQLRALGYL